MKSLETLFTISLDIMSYHLLILGGKGVPTF